LNRVRQISYIGSAVDLKRRAHYKSLKSGKSHNKIMQKDFNSDGEESFLFRIVDFCSEYECVQMEQMRINERDFTKLYNVAPIAGSTLGYQFTDEQKQKVRKNRLGVPFQIEKKVNMWRKRVEREWKAKKYEQLLNEYFKSNQYIVQSAELKCIINESINMHIPNIDISEKEKLQSWWRYFGGKKIIGQKYGLSLDSWNFLTNAGKYVKEDNFLKLFNCNSSKV
jgi:group I intron endonuclease